ncbi:MAG: TerB N-terminal domain-containing protein [Clostridia bacterium]|nr:TerB N-terminal domain-containing protein [Clostridia bacterium]
MPSEEEKSRVQKQDDFWDLDALLGPKKKSVQKERIPGADVSCVDVEADAPASPNGQGIVPSDKARDSVLSPFKKEQKPERPLYAYEPDLLLVSRVEIYPWKGVADYYDAFFEDAIRYMRVKGEPCEKVYFFSFYPQYVQMNKEQFHFYFWWREQTRQEKYLATEYSYLLLYLHELISLSVKIPPAYVCSQLLFVLKTYSVEYPRLLSFLGEWICDLCLIHQLKIPDFSSVSRSDGARQPLFLALEELRFGEKIGKVQNVRSFAEHLIRLSGYAYKKSRMYASHAELMDRWIPGAVEDSAKLIETMLADGKEQVVFQNAYEGAICCSKVKRKIKIFYRTPGIYEDLHAFFGKIIRYCECRLRKETGYRPELVEPALPDALKERITAYFLPLRQQMLRRMEKKDSRKAEEEAYLKYYDVPHQELSPENAARIEAQSWDTTEKLLQAFADHEDHEEETQVQGEPEPPQKNPVPAALPEPEEMETFPDDPEQALFEALRGGGYLPFLRAVAQGRKEGMRQCGAAFHAMPGALMEKINELALDALDDILLQETDGTIQLLGEYSPMVEKWLRDEPGVTL